MINIEDYRAGRLKTYSLDEVKERCDLAGGGTEQRGDRMKPLKEICPACGNMMTVSYSSFGFTRNGTNFIIEDVGRLECPICHEMSFTRKQTDALHKKRAIAKKL